MQVKTRRVTYSSIVGSADFQAGVRDYQNGVADFDRKCSKSAWHYERGRLYAAARAAKGFAPIPSRVGRRVNAFAIANVAEAFRAGDVI